MNVIEQSSLSRKWPHSWIDAQKLQNDVHALRQEPVHAHTQHHTPRLLSRASRTIRVHLVRSHIYTCRPCVACAVHRPSMTHRSMPTDAPMHFGWLSLHTLSPSSCIRPSFPLWTEPTAPPLPVLHHLHHVRPPATPSAHAAQPQPHTSFLVRAMHCACPCLAGAVCWWHQLSSSPVSATPTRPSLCTCPAPSLPMPDESTPLSSVLTHAITQPASAQAYPWPRAHQCHLCHVAPRPLDGHSVILHPGPPVFVLPPTPEPSQCPAVYWSAIPTLQPGRTSLVPPCRPLIAHHNPSPIPPASMDP